MAPGRTWRALLTSLRGRPRPSEPRQLVLWSRVGCHLCAEMLEVVSAVTAELAAPPVAIEVRDLDLAAAADPALLARYRDLVPVLLLDGVEVAHWRVDPATLRAALLRSEDDAP